MLYIRPIETSSSEVLTSVPEIETDLSMEDTIHFSSLNEAKELYGMG